MSEAPCPLCEPDPELVFYRGALVLGLWDGFLASEGHALLDRRTSLDRELWVASSPVSTWTSRTTRSGESEVCPRHARMIA